MAYQALPSSKYAPNLYLAKNSIEKISMRLNLLKYIVEQHKQTNCESTQEDKDGEIF